jgi:redox-sensitive bicupin YhaK (pirin superfamily)
MPAITVDDPSTLSSVGEADGTIRPVVSVTHAIRQLEGAGFPVWRGFHGLGFADIDPFLLLDEMGPLTWAPGTAKGAPWHPHRGFETVTYVLDGDVEHHDTEGGGGIIGEGDTQWMTAGRGLLHDELPSERAFREGGRQHGVQLWVNLPAASKMTDPRYQAIGGRDLTLLTTDDGVGLVRLIAGRIGEHAGPGATHTPITLAHATLPPGTELRVPWDPTYSAMAYVLGADGTAGEETRPIGEHQLARYGAGDVVVVRAATDASVPLEVLLLGGQPIKEPVVQYGPFVMNTEAEIDQAIRDFQIGKMGRIPTDAAGDIRRA